jgi:hypothetical protein
MRGMKKHKVYIFVIYLLFFLSLQYSSMSIACEYELAGDINYDYEVNLLDFDILVNQWLVSPGIPSADIAEPPDNFVDGKDFAIFAGDWLKTSCLTKINPSTNDGPEKNPLKGWNSGWWEDESRASVGFQYLPWNVVEPQKDVFDWNAVEDILSREGSDQRHLIIRFYCDWRERTDAPDWLFDDVALRQNGTHLATDYDDPDFIAQAIEVIQALADRYDNDPRIFCVELGVIGYWGEWHNYPDNNWWASTSTQQAIIDAYTNAFSRAQLQGRYPWKTLTATTSGIGYHNDYFSPTPHSDEFDDEIFARELWRQGPIGGEEPPPENTYANHYEMYVNGAGMQMVERGHYSTMKPAVFDYTDPEFGEGFMAMHKKMGYNYRLDEIRYTLDVTTSGDITVEVNGTNQGVAPMYMDWDVQIALLQNNNVAQLIPVSVDIRTWMPDETFSINITEPVNVTAGTYDLGLRIIQPGADLTKSRSQLWHLDARNVYIEFANDLPVIGASWNPQRALEGGWTMLNDGGIDITE